MSKRKTKSIDVQKNKIVETLSDKPIEKSEYEIERINPTDKRILRLEAQVAALENEKQSYRMQNKILKRKAAIFEAVVEEMQAICVPMDELPNQYRMDCKTKYHKDEDVVMHLSDQHFDEIIEPEQVQGLEEFNFPIAMRRAENYVHRTLEITQQTLSNYQFKNLWLLCYGDGSNGEIHNGVSRSAYRNQFRNCFAIGQVTALMIRDLAPYFQNVHVICVPGNHGRTTLKKDFNTPRDSWDYMIAETARMLCGNLTNVDFQIPNAYAVNVDINGHVFAIEHGDDVKSWNSIPYYGLERKSRRLAALNAAQQLKIDYFVFGHFHNPSMLAQMGNSETIINGAWKATDPYTLATYGSFVEPSQWVHGIHPKQGITWRFKVKLRSDDEKLGPKRYCVDLAS